MQNRPNIVSVRRRLGVGFVAVGLLVAAGCGSDTPTTTPDTTVAPVATTTESTLTDVVGELVGRGDLGFTQLAGMVVDAGLVETLRSKGPFTVFAPQDSAFRKLPRTTLHGVQDDEALLAMVLTYHVVPGKLKVMDLVSGPLKTVAGPDLMITREDGRVFVNGNRIFEADINATNGVIHAMDDVLVPPVGDIVAVATGLKGFSTLAALVTEAGLVSTLKGPGPFTVFAPSDDAFANVPKSTLDALGADKALLAKVLTYHVLPGNVTVEQLKEGKVTTVAGYELTVTKQDGKTFLDGKEIKQANVLATNGVVHVMGDVLVPT